MRPKDWGNHMRSPPYTVFPADYPRLTCTASHSVSLCQEPYTPGGAEWHGSSGAQPWLQVIFPGEVAVARMTLQNRNKS